MALLSVAYALPALAKPAISSVSPGTATKDVPVTFTASVSSGAAIQYCNLYVDLADVGTMTVNGGVASKSFTFNSGGSRIAFVFCRDTSGGMASGPNTSIWVTGAIVTTPPLSSPEPTPTPTPTPTPALTPTPTTTPTPEPILEPTSTPSGPSAGSLIKLVCSSGASSDHPCKAIYFYGTDGKRHAFPNEKVYFTWYSNFSSVQEVSATFMSSLPLGKNVTYRAGSKMVKFTTDPKVYAISERGTLRWVQTEGLAIGLYGTDWNKKIDDIADVFYTNYMFGSEISSLTEYSASVTMSLAATIDTSY